MIDWRFIGVLFACAALVAGPGWILAADLDGGRPALAAGLAFSFVSLALGYHWLRWGAARGGTRVLAAALGGFAGRVAGVLVFALAVTAGTDLDVTVALLTVAVAHLTFGMAEIAYLHRTGALR